MERSNQKLVLLTFGGKDSGKTFQLLKSLPGRKLVLSLDNQTKGVKDGALASDRNIWVVDVLQYYRDTQPEDITWAAKIATDFIEYAIQTIAPIYHPHWIIFDGGRKLEEIAEQKMRWLHRTAPTQGFKNRNWWKDRRFILRSFHRNALAVSQMGVGYTVYYDDPDLVTDKTPKWIDVIMEECEIEIETRTMYSPATRGQIYSAYVWGAKPHLRDFAIKGTTVDIPEGGGFPWGPGMAKRFEKAEKALTGVAIQYPQESADGAGTLHPLPPREDPPPEFVIGEDGAPMVPLPGGELVPASAAGSLPAPSAAAVAAPLPPPDFSKIPSNEV